MTPGYAPPKEAGRVKGLAREPYLIVCSFSHLGKTRSPAGSRRPTRTPLTCAGTKSQPDPHAWRRSGKASILRNEGWDRPSGRRVAAAAASNGERPPTLLPTLAQMHPGACSPESHAGDWTQAWSLGSAGFRALLRMHNLAYQMTYQMTNSLNKLLICKMVTSALIGFTCSL